MSESPTNHQLITGVWTTAWGPMGGVRSQAGIRRIILPHYGPKELRDLLAWETPGARADDGAFADPAALCRDYFNGKPVDFSALACNVSPLGPFAQKILTACRRIEYGRTVSYTQLAELAGERGKQRAVAQALGANPIPLVIPCHRITAAGGGVGGFSAPGGTELKQRMLELERAQK